MANEIATSKEAELMVDGAPETVTLYTVKPPKGRRMLPLGYFESEQAAIDATVAYKLANGIEW